MRKLEFIMPPATSRTAQYLIVMILATVILGQSDNKTVNSRIVNNDTTTSNISSLTNGKNETSADLMVTTTKTSVTTKVSTAPITTEKTTVLTTSEAKTTSEFAQSNSTILQTTELKTTSTQETSSSTTTTTTEMKTSSTLTSSSSSFNDIQSTSTKETFISSSEQTTSTGGPSSSTPSIVLTSNLSAKTISISTVSNSPETPLGMAGESSTESSVTGTVVGVVFAVIIILLLVVGALVYVTKTRNQRKKKKKSFDESILNSKSMSLKSEEPLVTLPQTVKSGDGKEKATKLEPDDSESRNVDSQLSLPSFLPPEARSAYLQKKAEMGKKDSSQRREKFVPSKALLSLPALEKSSERSKSEKKSAFKMSTSPKNNPKNVLLKPKPKGTSQQPPTKGSVYL